MGKISDTKHVDVTVRMGWYISYNKKVHILHAKSARPMDMLWTSARSGSTQQKYGVWWGDKWHAPIEAITLCNSSHTRI